GRAEREVPIPLTARQRGCVGEGCDGKAVPRREGLVVASRLGSLVAASKQNRARIGEPAPDFVLRDPEFDGQLRILTEARQDRGALPVAAARNPVGGREQAGGTPQAGATLRARPHECGALLALGVAFLPRADG